MWNEKVVAIMTDVMKNGEIPHIGLLTYNNNGYPISLPNHFQILKNRFFFSSLPNSKHTNDFLKKPKISFTLYYPSLNQTTILFKGVPILVKKNSVKYNYGEQNLTNHLFELKIDSIDFSELDPISREEKGITRKIQTIYPLNNKVREIFLNNDLDDLEAFMHQKNFSPSIV